MSQSPHRSAPSEPISRLFDGLLRGILGVVLLVHALSYLLGGMLMEGSFERLLWSLTFLEVGGTSTILVGWAFLFGGMFGLVSAASRIRPVVRGERSDDRRGEDRSPVAALRDRYARGEIGDEEFERKLDRLLEAEQVRDETEPGRAETLLE